MKQRPVKVVSSEVSSTERISSLFGVRKKIQSSHRRRESYLKFGTVFLKNITFLEVSLRFLHGYQETHVRGLLVWPESQTGQTEYRKSTLGSSHSAQKVFLWWHNPPSPLFWANIGAKSPKYAFLESVSFLIPKTSDITDKWKPESDNPFSSEYDADDADGTP